MFCVKYETQSSLFNVHICKIQRNYIFQKEIQNYFWKLLCFPQTSYRNLLYSLSLQKTCNKSRLLQKKKNVKAINYRANCSHLKSLQSFYFPEKNTDTDISNSVVCSKIWRITVSTFSQVCLIEIMKKVLKTTDCN